MLPKPNHKLPYMKDKLNSVNKTRRFSISSFDKARYIDENK